jgi:hypothetical protein
MITLDVKTLVIVEVIGLSVGAGQGDRCAKSGSNLGM